MPKLNVGVLTGNIPAFYFKTRNMFYLEMCVLSVTGKCFKKCSHSKRQFLQCTHSFCLPKLGFRVNRVAREFLEGVNRVHLVFIHVILVLLQINR